MSRTRYRQSDVRFAVRQMSKLHKNRPNIFWAILYLAVILAGVFAVVYVYNLEYGKSRNDGLVHGQMHNGSYYSSGVTYEAPKKALAELDSLPVAPKDHAHYDREALFGDFDYRFDNSSCPTRDSIRFSELDNVKSDGCKVLSGTLDYDSYTGKRDVEWSRSDAASLQIDHVVSLEDACFSGACTQWGTGGELDKMASKSKIITDVKTRRLELANDPLNLILVDGHENQSKGSKTADEWLVPHNRAYRCEYASIQVFVKYKYGLTVSSSEADALRKELTSCV